MSQNAFSNVFHIPTQKKYLETLTFPISPKTTRVKRLRKLYSHLNFIEEKFLYFARNDFLCTKFHGISGSEFLC